MRERERWKFLQLSDQQVPFGNLDRAVPQLAGLLRMEQLCHGVLVYILNKTEKKKYNNNK